MRLRRAGKTSEVQGDKGGSGAASAVAEVPSESAPIQSTPSASVLGQIATAPQPSASTISEWGSYDPEMAGIGALISSIDLTDIPIPDGIDDSLGDLLLRQNATPVVVPAEVFRPDSPADADVARQPTAASAVASCRVSHLAPLSLWAHVTDGDRATSRLETPDLVGSLLSQWLVNERCRRKGRLASSDLAAQIGGLTHPAHVALTGLSPVCRIRGVRTAPAAVLPDSTDETPGWPEPAYTPVPETIAVEYLQESAAERAAAPAPESEAAADATAAAAPELVPEASPELVPEPAQEPALEGAPDMALAPAIVSAPEPDRPTTLETTPEPVFETTPEPVFEASPEPMFEASAEIAIEPASSLTEFEPAAVAPPAFDAIPVDFMIATGPAVDFTSFEAGSFDRGTTPPIELEPATEEVPVEREPAIVELTAGAEPAIVVLPIEAEPPTVADPVELESATIAQAVAPEPAIITRPVDLESAMVEEPVDPQPACAAPLVCEDMPQAAEPAAEGPVSVTKSPDPPQSLQPPVKKRRRTALALG
jgi:hypothetical protein